MKINITINSGTAYLISLGLAIAYAAICKASFGEFFFAIASLYGWHTGRRLWRQLKGGPPQDQDFEDPGRGAANA